MRRDTRTLLGRGALVGAALAIADVIGALIARGKTFDPRPAGLLLLAVTVLVGATLGVIAAALVRVLPAASPAVLRLTSGRRAVGVGAALVFLTIGISAATRREAEAVVDRGPAQPQRPSVLLLVIDTLRADALDSAPALAGSADLGRFAAQATTFRNAEAASGWTLPSVGTLFTGRHPTGLGLDEGRILGADADTLAEAFARAGYATHAFVDNPILEAERGYAQGFTTFRGRSALRFAMQLPLFRLLGTRVMKHARESLPVAYEGCEAVTGAATAALADDTGPVFFYVHLMDPHAPYYRGAPHGTPALPSLPFDRFERLGADALDAEARVALRAHYQTEVAAAAACSGALIREFLTQRGPSSIVVLTADHGEEFFEHGELGHGHSLHREVVHVPLIVSLGAHRPAPVVVNEPVGLVDVGPTLLDAAGLPAWNGVDGRSLVTLLGETAAAGAPAPNAARAPGPQGRAVYSSLFSKGRRIYRLRQGNTVALTDRQGETVQVYDLDSDPTEQRPGAAPDPEVIRRFVSGLTAAPATPPTEPSQEALRALGYIQ